jgi:AraC-like DNA-binding protein
MNALAHDEGQRTVEDLAVEAGVTRKYLADLFRRDVGISPKAIARVYRFQSALKILAGRERVPWVELAAHCGYYDQSHLTRDFKAFSGFTPGEFVRMARPDATSVVVE